MTDTRRSVAEILALLADNSTGDISPQDLRDALVTALGVYGEIQTIGGDTVQNVGTSWELLENWNTDGESAGITPASSSDKLTITIPGIYLVMATLGIKTTSSWFPMDFRLYLDGAGVGPISGFFALTAGYGAINPTVHLIALVDADEGEDLEVYTRVAASTQNIKLAEASLLARMIG